MGKPRTSTGVVIGENVTFGDGVVIWNFVVVGDRSRIGDRTVIGSFCDVGKDVSIGRDCVIQAHVTISNECKVGDNVFIAPNTSLLNDKYPKSGLLTPVTVEDNATIGGGVTILPDVTIGRNAMVGGGSVVTKNVGSDSVVVGVPAHVTMSLKEYITKQSDFVTKRRHR